MCTGRWWRTMVCFYRKKVQVFIRCSKESVTPQKVRTTDAVLLRTSWESMLTEEFPNNYNSVQFSRGAISWTFWTVFAGRSTPLHRAFRLSESPSNTGSDAPPFLCWDRDMAQDLWETHWARMSKGLTSCLLQWHHLMLLWCPQWASWKWLFCQLR